MIINAGWYNTEKHPVDSAAAVQADWALGRTWVNILQTRRYQSFPKSDCALHLSLTKSTYSLRYSARQHGPVTP
jgi:hypothetical protein